MISISDRPAFLAACDHARTIALSSYILPESVTERLATEARRGAVVRVTLPAQPYADTVAERHELAARNRRAVNAIERAGGHGTLLPQSKPLHMKVAVLDDAVAYLDDRNWSDDERQTILRDDDRGDVDTIRKALGGVPAANDHLTTVKPQSLALESTLIRGAREPLSVESESFNKGPVYDALLHAAQRGVSTRLLVAQREIDAALAKGKQNEVVVLGTLASAGVEVRVTPSDEKLAVCGKRGWVGSTNATSLRGAGTSQFDWGMTTKAAAVVDGLRGHFENTWSGATPLARYTADKVPSAARALASARATTSSTPIPSTWATVRAVSAT